MNDEALVYLDATTKLPAQEKTTTDLITVYKFGRPFLSYPLRSPINLALMLGRQFL